MKTTISYLEAQNIWKKYLTTPYLKLHTRETEVIMRKLAEYFNEDADFWGITGLLHDLEWM